MAQKNDTTALLIAFLLTAGIVGSGFWWFTQRSGIKLDNLSSVTAPTNSPPSGGQAQGTASAPMSAGNAGNSTVGDFAKVTNVPSGLFNYGGSTSWAPIRLTVDAAITAARPEFRLRYTQPVGSTAGSGTGIRMLIRDELVIAQSSRPILDQEIQQAQQRGFKLKQIQVAIDGIAVVVNPGLNVPGLTLDQLAAIYNGQVTNWRDVGGANLAIVPITRPVTAGGTIELFVETILKGSNFGANVQFVNSTTDALRKLAASPGGIYFASAPEVVPQCTVKPLPLGRRSGEWVAPYQEPFVPSDQCPTRRNQVNATAFQNGQYPLTRNFYVVVKENGGAEQQAGEAYANLLLTAQGQELIAKAGFVRIR